MGNGKDNVHRIDGAVVEVCEEGERCFVRATFKRDGQDASVEFPIAHGTFDLIRKKCGGNGTAKVATLLKESDR